MYRDLFLFRYDRDPNNHPEMPEHKHLSPGERRVAESSRPRWCNADSSSFAAAQAAVSSITSSSFLSRSSSRTSASDSADR